MKKQLAILLFFSFGLLNAQSNLPKGMTEGEKEIYGTYLEQVMNKQMTDPPSVSVRTPAEWEEHQGIFLSWTYQEQILREIVRHSVDEMTVYINTSNPGQVQNYLENGGVNTENVVFVDYDFDTIWIRDYGPWTIYYNDVEELAIVDWIYNRPRPRDDEVPQQIANDLGIDFYETNGGGYDLVATGGNFMADGLGRGFSSELIIEENPSQSVSNINSILNDFMGIDEYVLMNTLPYDGIHHIDMHMKLLNEETLLVGQYPDGVSDGPQIEANLQYILENYDSPFGTPYKVVRVEMPPDQWGDYPSQNGYYRTFTNSVFVNKTLIVPTYEEPYDSEALAAYEEALPGYNVVGIDCNSIIPASGAIHCITKMVGVDDPIWIVHQNIADQVDEDEGYFIEAQIKAKDSVLGATLHYKQSNETEWTAMLMEDAGNNMYTATIPAIDIETADIEYYIEAISGMGKTVNRPLTAPEGYFKFNAINNNPTVSTGLTSIGSTSMQNVYPNPSRGITVIPLNFGHTYENVTVNITDLLGRSIELIYDGNVFEGEKNLFVNTANYTSGAYLVDVQFDGQHLSKKFIVK